MSDKKVAIITGTSSGVGLATSTKFLASGWHVFGVDINPAPESLASNKSTFSFLQIDVSKSKAAKEIFAAAQTAFGSTRINALLNVAGIMDRHAGVDNMRDEDWDRVMAINLTGPAKLMREAVNVMKANGGGSIVNVCSKASTSGAVSGAAYCASKHGLLGITKNTAWMFKDEGIRCNAITPGGIQTNIVQSSPPETWDMVGYSKLAPVTGLNLRVNNGVVEHWPKASEPAVIAEVLLFLASDASVGINGAVVPVDHAWSTI
ncbi:hypothetical protein V5O48_008946 [Marasmius crinis-equi]|uniref:Uncharacterized protein n=1 Tax=Marasmius crinis-equi TaxID=585013 RepID=A0ABR3FD05_9AGAR